MKDIQSNLANIKLYYSQNRINPYHQSGNAYPYFYKMTITGKLLYDYLNEIYKNNPIDKFMDKSYQFMVENEEEIRKQMI